MWGKMVIEALLIVEASDWLTAVSVTVIEVGTAAGARKSTPTAGAVEMDWHGFDPAAQTWPKIVLPPAIPFTNQFIFAFAAPVMLALNVCRWLMARVAPGGVTDSTAPLTSVMLAVAVLDALALLVARSVRTKI